MKYLDRGKNTGLLIPFLLGIFLVGTTGFTLLPEIGLFNGKRVLEALLLLLILSATVLNPGLRISFGQVLATLPRWVLYSLMTAALIGTLSSLRFEHPAYSLLEIALPALLILCVIAMAASRNISGDSFDRFALSIVIAIGLIVSITELAGLVASWVIGLEYKFDNMLIRFFHPRFYNQLQTLSIPLIAVLPFLWGGTRKLKVIAVVLIALQWCLVLISGGRGTVVSLVLAFTLSALLFSSNRRAWLGLQAAGLVLGMVMFFSVLGVSKSVNPAEGQFYSQSIGRPMAHTSGRLYMWGIGWQQARAQPLLGAGPARFDCELHPATPAHPHSFPVTLLAEWGFLAFFLVMAVCGWLGWHLIVKCRQNQDGQNSSDVLVAMLGCSMMAAAVHSLASGVLIMPASQVMVILVGGWALGRLIVPESNAKVSHLKTTATLVAAVTLAAWVLAFSVNEIWNMEQRVNQEDLLNIIEPRFWESGHSCHYVYDVNGSS